MAMSDMAYPVFPFSLQQSLLKAKKCSLDDDNDFNDFDRYFADRFQDAINKTKPDEYRIKANLKGLGNNTMFQVSVFKTQEEAIAVMRECEVGDCGQQYQVWKYKEEQRIPKAVCQIFEPSTRRCDIDWGVFEVYCESGDDICSIESEQCIARYFDDEYSSEMRKMVTNLGMGDDAVEKILGDDKVECISGPKTVAELLQLLSSYNDDTHVTFKINDSVYTGVPAILKQSANLIYLSLNVPRSECTVKKLHDVIAKCQSSKYMTFNFRGHQFEIGEIRRKNKYELFLNLISWGSED